MRSPMWATHRRRQQSKTGGGAQPGTTTAHAASADSRGAGPADRGVAGWVYQLRNTVPEVAVPDGSSV